MGSDDQRLSESAACHGGASAARASRVEPWMSYRMAARLQAADPPGRPVLLRVASDAGHGIGTSLASAIDQEADVLAFLFHALGMR